MTKIASIFCGRSIWLAIAVFLLCVDSAQTQPLTDLPRPQLKNDGTFEIPGVGYAPRYYFDRDADNKEDNEPTYVFYEPVLSLVTQQTETGERILLYHLDEEKGVLTFGVKLYRDREEIRKAILNRLNEKYPNSGNYQIEPLSIKTAYLESSRIYGTEKIVSDEMELGWSESGQINVYFQDEIGRLNEFVTELITPYGEGFLAQIRLQYSFDGVGNTTCSATIDSQKAEKSELLHTKEGEGRVGLITRDQALDIATDLIERQAITAECHNVKFGDDLLTKLLQNLGPPSPSSDKITTLQDVLKLIKYDEKSLVADIEARLKEIDNKEEREYLLKEFFEATGSKKNQEKGGFSANISLTDFKLDGVGLSEASSETATKLGKDIEDKLNKRGKFVEYNPESRRFIPKTVDLYTYAVLQNKWSIERKFNFTVRSEGEGGDSRLLSFDSLAEEEWQSLNAWFERKFEGEFNELLRSKGINRMGGFDAILLYVDDPENGIPRDNLVIDVQDNVWIKGGRRVLIEGVTTDVDIDAQRNVEINAQDDVRINAQGKHENNDGDVDIDAQADVFIDAQDDVVINAQDVVGINAQDVVGINAQADVGINAQDDVVINAQDLVGIIGDRVFIKGSTKEKSPIYLETCTYVLRRGSSNSNGWYKFDTGRIDNLAVLSDVWSNYGQFYEVGLSRRGGDGAKSNNWHIFVTEADDSFSSSDWIEVTVLFAGGTAISRSRKTYYVQWKQSTTLRQTRSSCSK